MKVLLILVENSRKTENFSRSALFPMKTRVSLKYLVSYCRFTFPLFEYLDNKVYINVKETTKKYIFVRMKESSGDEPFLESF